MQRKIQGRIIPTAQLQQVSGLTLTLEHVQLPGTAVGTTTTDAQGAFEFSLSAEAMREAKRLGGPLFHVAWSRGGLALGNSRSSDPLTPSSSRLHVVTPAVAGVEGMLADIDPTDYLPASGLADADFAKRYVVIDEWGQPVEGVPFRHVVEPSSVLGQDLGLSPSAEVVVAEGVTDQLGRAVSSF
ncbi:MAG: hypothetical protein KGR25_13110, partial [Chloroflexi bacterium]|nr:hypothetical protein [Chloroflexota bacterium]